MKLVPSQSPISLSIDKWDFGFGPVLSVLACPAGGTSLGSRYHLLWIENRSKTVGCQRDIDFDLRKCLLRMRLSEFFCERRVQFLAAGRTCARASW